jgi:hypothetical protein
MSLVRGSGARSLALGRPLIVRDFGRRLLAFGNLRLGPRGRDRPVRLHTLVGRLRRPAQPRRRTLGRPARTGVGVQGQDIDPIAVPGAQGRPGLGRTQPARGHQQTGQKSTQRAVGAAGARRRLTRCRPAGQGNKTAACLGLHLLTSYFRTFRLQPSPDTPPRLYRSAQARALAAREVSRVRCQAPRIWHLGISCGGVLGDAAQVTEFLTRPRGSRDRGSCRRPRRSSSR